MIWLIWALTVFVYCHRCFMYNSCLIIKSDQLCEEEWIINSVLKRKKTKTYRKYTGPATLHYELDSVVHIVLFLCDWKTFKQNIKKVIKNIANYHKYILYIIFCWGSRLYVFRYICWYLHSIHEVIFIVNLVWYFLW